MGDTTTHTQIEQLELIARFLNERHRAHLAGKAPVVQTISRVAYAAGVTDVTKEILSAFTLTLRKVEGELPLTFEPSGVFKNPILSEQLKNTSYPESIVCPDFAQFADKFKGGPDDGAT